MTPPLARITWPLTRWPAALARNATTAARSVGAQPARRPLGDDERAADVGAVHVVQHGQVEVDEWPEHHPARRVRDHVDTAELELCGVEHRGDRVLVSDVGLDRDGPATPVTTATRTLFPVVNHSLVRYAPTM